ncbi:MAG TPA: PstS family phosphate ABC transporter substrate-binding protein [Coriobacteriia bacterium]|nr:PstS family phosphate ABC transporter substrate-binding protein [Coriobacteriia bacterium]
MKRKRIHVFALTAVLALGTLGLAGCGAAGETETPDGDGAAAELSGEITVEGSDTMVNLGQAFAEAFMEENPEVMIAVKGGGTGTGLAALINGTVDFANASRDMKDEERAQIEAGGGTVYETAVAVDGIAVVVHPDNPVTEISMADLGRIYRGEITNWSELGGPDREIVVLSRDTASGTYEFFLETVVAAEDENAEMTPAAQMLGSTQAIVSEVTGNEGAIGYVGLGYLTDQIQVVAVDGVAASVETARDGSYPISRNLYMYAAKTPEGVMAAYLEWILGEAGQAIVVDQGFVPLD